MAQANSTRDVVPAFGAAVREMRAAKGMTAMALAELAGTQPRTIGRLESGERAPSLRLALRVAKALGTTVDALSKGWDS